jgi:hypothetical protein
MKKPRPGWHPTEAVDRSASSSLAWRLVTLMHRATIVSLRALPGRVNSPFKLPPDLHDLGDPFSGPMAACAALQPRGPELAVDSLRAAFATMAHRAWLFIRVRGPRKAAIAAHELDDLFEQLLVFYSQPDAAIEDEPEIGCSSTDFVMAAWRSGFLLATEVRPVGRLFETMARHAGHQVRERLLALGATGDQCNPFAAIPVEHGPLHGQRIATAARTPFGSWVLRCRVRSSSDFTGRCAQMFYEFEGAGTDGPLQKELGQ